MLSLEFFKEIGLVLLCRYVIKSGGDEYWFWSLYFWKLLLLICCMVGVLILLISYGCCIVFLEIG